jgi:hypothetical protein
MKENDYATEVQVCIDLTQETAADIVPGQLFFGMAQFDVSVRHLFMWREDTSNCCCDYPKYIQSSDKSPSHEQEVLTKEYSYVTTEKCYKGKNFVSFVATGESTDILC